MSFFDKFAEAFGSRDEPPRVKQLDEWLEETLKREMGFDEIERDEDGDIPIRSGSTVVFVRASDEDPPFIEVFAPLLLGFTLSPDVYEAVNSINLQVPLAKAVVDKDGDQITLSADIFIIDELSADQLMATIELIGDRADYYDTMLQKRFGGRTMLRDGDEDQFDV